MSKYVSGAALLVVVALADGALYPPLDAQSGSGSGSAKGGGGGGGSAHHAMARDPGRQSEPGL